MKSFLSILFPRTRQNPAVPLPFSSLIFLCHLLPGAFFQAYFITSSPWTVVIWSLNKHIYKHPQDIVMDFPFSHYFICPPLCLSAWLSTSRGSSMRSLEDALAASKFLSNVSQELLFMQFPIGNKSTLLAYSEWHIII